MTRGRAPNLALPLTRSLAQQREYRARRAARLKELEDEIVSLKEQVDVLKRERNIRKDDSGTDDQTSSASSTHLVSTIFTLEHILQSHGIAIPPNLVLIIQRLRKSPFGVPPPKALLLPGDEHRHQRDAECADPSCPLSANPGEPSTSHGEQPSYASYQQNKRRRVSSDTGPSDGAGWGARSRPTIFGATEGVFAVTASTTNPGGYWHQGSGQAEQVEQREVGSYALRRGSSAAPSPHHITGSHPAISAGVPLAYHGARSYSQTSSTGDMVAEQRVSRLSYASEDSGSYSLASRQVDPGYGRFVNQMQAYRPRYEQATPSLGAVGPLRPSQSGSSYPSQSPHPGSEDQRASSVTSAASYGDRATLPNYGHTLEAEGARLDVAPLPPVTSPRLPSGVLRLDRVQTSPKPLIPPQRAHFNFDPQCCSGLFSCDDMPMELRSRCDSAVKLAVDPAISDTTMYDTIIRSPVFGVDSPNVVGDRRRDEAIADYSGGQHEGCGSAAGCGSGMKCNDMPPSARKAMACQEASQTLSLAPPQTGPPYHAGAQSRIANLQPSYTLPTTLEAVDAARQRSWGSRLDTASVLQPFPLIAVPNSTDPFHHTSEDKSNYGFQPEACCLGLVDCGDQAQTCPIAN